MSLNDHAAEIRRLCAEGRSQREIAQMMGVCRASIQKVMRRHGIAARPRGGSSMAGPASPHWKGDDVGYVAFHYRVNVLRGRPSRCERCGLDDPAQRYEWANLTGDYANPDDFQRMCVTCHRRFDSARQVGPGYLSATEAAARAGMPLRTFTRHIKLGLIAAQKSGGETGPYRITEAALADYLQRRMAEAAS